MNIMNVKQRYCSIFLYLVILLFFVFQCKRNPYETRMKEAIAANDHLAIAAICSEYTFEEYKKECESSLLKSENDIQEIIFQKQELPFMKLILEPQKSQKIQQLLRANVELGIKYRSIWNETAEVYSE